MTINLNGVENTQPKKYIKEAGYYTLKCTEVKFLRTSENNNPVYRFTFVNKNDEYFNDDITITQNTKWKIKQLATAFGFDYDNVNIMHFIGMYLVAYLETKKVLNKVGEKVDILECKSYTKSKKLTNDIPPENTPYKEEPKVVYENGSPYEPFDDSEIPF